MENQNQYWAVNLKFLRIRKRLSQDELAETLGVTRSKLKAHENGNTRNPPIEDLLKFSTFYKLSIDTLIKVDLSRLSELSVRELEAGNDPFAMGTKLRVLATTVDKGNNENTEYVPYKAQAGYAAGYADPEYIASLPKFSMPQLARNKTYRMFPTSGASMLPIPENSLVVGEYVSDWMALKDDTLCIVILKTGGLVFKQVVNRIKEDASLELRSLNPEFTPYFVGVEEVLEIWKFVNYISDTVPAGNITLATIANAVKDIQVKVAKLSSKR